MPSITVNYKGIAKVAQAVRALILPNNSNDLDDMNDKIQKLLGVIISYTNSDIFDGCIQWNFVASCPEIIISRQDGFYRREFTIAHELGHLFLHWKWYPGKNIEEKARKNANVLGACGHAQTRPITLYRGNIVKHGNELIEQEANEFAANLLMPKNDIINIYNHSSDKSLDSVKQTVSKQFHVSEDAAFHRLSNLNERKELHA